MQSFWYYTLSFVAVLLPTAAFSKGVDDHRSCISQLNSAYTILSAIEDQGASLKSSKKVGAGTMALAYSKQLNAESAMKAYIDQLSKACSELR